MFSVDCCHLLVYHRSIEITKISKETFINTECEIEKNGYTIYQKRL